MSVQVVGGDLGGRKLDCPPGLSVRPMTARVKNAVFNILGEKVQGAKVLDLYAGSGGLGVEALSRGAASAVFVEKDAVHAEFLRRNLESLGISAKCRVLVQENRAAFRVLEKEGKSFDLILADPPFSRDRKVLPPEVSADLVALSASLIWKGILVLEHRGGRPSLPKGLVPTDQRDYGDATVSWFAFRILPGSHA